MCAKISYIEHVQILNHIETFFVDFFSRKHIDTTPVDSVEFIFDYDDDFDRLLQIIHVVVKRVDHYEEKDEYPLLALEMRFMAYRFAHAT